jgi:hypothetical protein
MADVKTDMAPTTETKEYSVENAVPARSSTPSSQKATKQMMFISLYVSLAGWIFNFDLGMSSALPTLPLSRAVVQGKLTRLVV